MGRITAAIVTHNNAATVREAVASLARYLPAGDIYVVDNASSDDTVRIVSGFEGVKLTARRDNPGFGAGHNTVISQISSDYHLMMNPDIAFAEDVPGILGEYLDSHPEAVLATPLILNPDGTPQAVPRTLPKRRYMLASQLERFGQPFVRWRDEYTRRNEPVTGPTSVTFCTGCFMMVRTRALRSVHGFDDRFFLYCEDADLSRRLAPYGRLMLVPGAKVTHAWEHASGKSWKYLMIHLKSMHAYFKKWRRVD